MGLFGLPGGDLPAATYCGVVARYQQLRPIRLRLNHELVGRLSQDVLRIGASRLGMLKNGVFVFNTEDETSVLMDYCIYDVYREGRNAVEQYLCDCPPDPDSDEMTCLRAMQQATYAMMSVLRVESGVGVQVRNFFTEETQLLVDLGLSKSARPGLLLGTRLLDFHDFTATGGAAIPLGVLDESQLEQWQTRISTGIEDRDFDPAPLIRRCLEAGMSSHVRYERSDTERRIDMGHDVGAIESSAQRKRKLAARSANKVSANRRCGCGSGKMFKNCCGKR